jgi:hypothetical protein
VVEGGTGHRTVTANYFTEYQVVEEVVEGGTGHRTELTWLLHNT